MEVMKPRFPFEPFMDSDQEFIFMGRVDSLDLYYQSTYRNLPMLRWNRARARVVWANTCGKTKSGKKRQAVRLDLFSDGSPLIPLQHSFSRKQVNLMKDFIPAWINLYT